MGASCEMAIHDSILRPGVTGHYHESPYLICNRCGRVGADWYRGQRPGWGSLALCKDCARELDIELVRHIKALKELRTVRYEQDTALSRDKSGAISFMKGGDGR